MKAIGIVIVLLAGVVAAAQRYEDVFYWAEGIP